MFDKSHKEGKKPLQLVNSCWLYRIAYSLPSLIFYDIVPDSGNSSYIMTDFVINAISFLVIWLSLKSGITKENARARCDCAMHAQYLVIQLIASSRHEHGGITKAITTYWSMVIPARAIIAKPRMLLIQL